MRKNFKLLGAVAVAGLVATTGSAFTASNTLNGDNVAGFNTDVVSGATTTKIEHTLSADGSTITSTALTFDAVQPASSAVKAGFGTTLFTCQAVPVGTATTSADYTCQYTTAFDTKTANSFAVAVS